MQNAPTLYFISGLGADERIFKKLKIPAGYAVKYISWIEPLPNESLESYSRRLALQIDTTSDFMLVGLSFGGIVAVELNKFLKPQKTILISSIATKAGLPPFLRMVNKTKLHKLVPAWLLHNFYAGAYWFFEATTDDEKKLLASFMKNASGNLLRWSIDKVVSWKNEIKPEHICLLHGTNDRVFPYSRCKPDILIEDGGHLMVYNKAEIISRVLAEKLLE